MNLTELFDNKTVFSLEVFPPKKGAPGEAILPTIQQLQAINPDFISVTLGAGGSDHYAGTVSIADLIQNHLNIPTVAHVPGLYQTESQVLQLLDQLSEINVKNILALRGDKIPDKRPTGVFDHANQLVAFVHEKRPDFNIISACYPNCHYEATSFVDDIAHLKEKVDAGAKQLISQMFFDNQSFYDFKEKVENAGIRVPIEAGIMPCTSKKQTEKDLSNNGRPPPKGTYYNH